MDLLFYNVEPDGVFPQTTLFQSGTIAAIVARRIIDESIALRKYRLVRAFYEPPSDSGDVYECAKQS